MTTEPCIAWVLKSAKSLNMALEPAWLLHRRSFGDGGFLVELFGLNSGRFSAVLRGAGRKNRGGSLIGLALPFTPLLIKAAGKGELKTLHQLETSAASVKLAGRALFKGLYANELLMRTLPRYDPYPRLFAAYGRVLPQLMSNDELPLREFELALLDELGYELIFAHDAEGGYIDPDASYGYQPSIGFERKVFQREERATDLGNAKCHSLTVSGNTLFAIAQWRHGDYSLSSTDKQWLKRIIRMALAEQLNGKPLKSRELFKAFVAGESTHDGLGVDACS